MNRRKIRQLILQILYQVDVGKMELESALEERLEEVGLVGRDATFARELAEGAWENRAEADELLSRFSKDWSLERLARVDRNILRLAIFEIRHRPDIPAKVSVNEAVELAKRFSDDSGYRFVNGILGSVIRTLGGDSVDE